MKRFSGGCVPGQASIVCHISMSLAQKTSEVKEGSGLTLITSAARDLAPPGEKAVT